MRADSFVENGLPIPFAEAVTSGLSVGVPGTPATWELALDRWGSIDLRQALRPAARLASRGFVVDETFRQQTADNAARFAAFPSTRELFLPGGAPPEVGSVLRNRDLARTYTQLGKRGTDYLYEGRLGEDIVATVKQPPVDPSSTLLVRPGLMRQPDLDRYRALLRAPTLIDYRGLTIAGMAPPSSGGSTVGEALNILESSDLADLDRSEALHRYLEATALAFADRNRYVGDPAFVHVPLRELLSQGFADERACLIGPTAAAKPVPPGSPDGSYASCAAAAAGADRTVDRGRSTTHLTTWDRWGNVVSYTLTIEQTGGSGIVVPNRGFLLNNELTDFNFTPTQGAGARSEPAGSGQTASLVDEPHHRARRRRAGTGDRLARWLDDHHHRYPDADQPAGFRDAAARRGRCSSGVATEHRGRLGRACLHHDLGTGADRLAVTLSPAWRRSGPSRRSSGGRTVGWSRSPNRYGVAGVTRASSGRDADDQADHRLTREEVREKYLKLHEASRRGPVIDAGADAGAVPRRMARGGGRAVAGTSDGGELPDVHAALHRAAARRQAAGQADGA